MNKNLDILIYNLTTQKIPSKEFFRKNLDDFLKKLKEKRRVELSLIFVSPLQMKKLNFSWRKKNKSTSVLSFPSQFLYLLRKKTKYKLFLKKKDLEEIIDLGEIIFCPKIIKKQADKEKTSEKEIYRRLLAHSLLHLYGYSHNKKADLFKMLKLETKLLENK